MPVDLKDGRLKIVTESTEWPDLPVRRASINSFGYGGANAHTIIESVESVVTGYRSLRQTDASSTKSLDSIADTFGNSYSNGHRGGKGHANGHANGHTGGHKNGHGNNRILPVQRKQFLLPFSAHDEKTLRSNVSALRHVSTNWNLVDIAHTLSVRRSVFSYRSFLVMEIGKVNENLEPEKLTVAKRLGLSVPTIGFVFTGKIAR